MKASRSLSDRCYIHDVTPPTQGGFFSPQRFAVACKVLFIGKIYSKNVTAGLPSEIKKITNGETVFAKINWNKLGLVIAAVLIYAIVLNELIPEEARYVGTNSMYIGHPPLSDSAK
ncbi:MAG TPA: hypothetical protein VN089_11160 [Duganella sp.]|nr:hypothetical protein [Duganella sp.]